MVTETDGLSENVKVFKQKIKRSWNDRALETASGMAAIRRALD